VTVTRRHPVSFLAEVGQPVNGAPVPRYYQHADHMEEPEAIVARVTAQVLARHPELAAAIPGPPPPLPCDADLGALRKRCRISVAAIAAACGTGAAEVLSWERRRTVPGGDAGDEYARLVAEMIAMDEEREARS
jgi:DNA-binding transcriptional regulator YiaG